MDKKLLSIIVPCYNEEKTILRFYEAIKDIRENLHTDTEIIFIDDGSTDSTLQILRGLSKQNCGVRYVSFSKNFGKDAGIFAGLERAKGDYIAIMDTDLQDPPGLLPEMIDILDSKEFDRVITRRVDRKGEPLIRSFFARIFYRMINRITSIDIADGTRDYQMMTRKVVDSVLMLKEHNRFSKGIFAWVGFRTKCLEFENTNRIDGETKWSFGRLFWYAIDGIFSFSTFPLVLTSVFGIIMCLIAFIFIVVIVIKTLVFGDPTSGWPSLACIILLVSGIQLFFMGILGQYIAKIHIESKNRPIYLVAEEK